MKLFLSLIALIFTCLLVHAAPTGPNPGLDIGTSGTIPGSTIKPLRVINIQKATSIGYELNVTSTTGTITNASAAIQCSNDGVNFATLPIMATGDASNVVTIPSGSGVYYLMEGNLACNYAQVLYNSGSGGGTITVQEFAKVHGINY